MVFQISIVQTLFITQLEKKINQLPRLKDPLMRFQINIIQTLFITQLEKRLNKDKTIAKVRESTNDILSKYSPNSFYYSIENHEQRRFQSYDLSLMTYFKLLTLSY
jgi:hypothetical protein